MRFSTGLALLVAVGVVATSDPALAQESASHRHMGHVLDGFRGTPEGQGLLPTAAAEAQVAATHAGLALRNPDDLGAIQRHIGHVMNAIDPTVEESGPGKGYGLVQAAQGVATHIGLAANSDGASDNIKTHANHVSMAANNVVTWGWHVLELGEQVKNAESAGAVAELAKEIQMAIQAIVDGDDADTNGRTSWSERCCSSSKLGPPVGRVSGAPGGGLAQAEQHMGLMKRGEGRN